jgi:glycosyltransferase involved in cell wall biosynthesis
MRVLLIMGGIEDGGLEKHFVDLCNALADSCEVIAVAHSKYAPLFDDEVCFEEVDLSKGRRNLKVLYRLFRIISKYKPDVVHAQANKAAQMIAYIRRFISAKCIVTMHNSRQVGKAYLNKFDHLVVVSKQAKDLYKHSSISLIYNGFSRPLNALTVALKTDSPNVLAVGRLTAIKGFDVLLQAWTSVDANLYIIGDGEQREELERLSKLLELDGRIHFLGYRSNVYEYMNAADLLVISSHKEGFPYVMVEALQAKLPVVSTPVSGAIDILPSCALSDGHSPKSLSLCINFALKNLNEYNSRFDNAFEFADKNLTLSAMKDQNVMLYKKAVSNG